MDSFVTVLRWTARLLGTVMASHVIRGFAGIVVPFE